MNQHVSSDGASAKAEVLLEGRSLSKTYEAAEKRPAGHQPPLVLDHIQLEIHAGEFVALLGPSDSGKSIVLRILAGVLSPSSGQVFFNGMPQHGPNPHVAIVFQSFALFPWLTVLQNVELGLEAQPLTRTQRLKRALSSIDMIALVVEPQLLFMDAPFSSLDVLTAGNLRKALLGLRLSQSMPTQVH